MAATAIVLAHTPEVLAQASTSKVIADIDLAKVFGARSDWRLVASQETQPPDPYDYSIATVHLCLSETRSGACSSGLAATPPASDWGAQYLNVAKVVYPRGRSQPPLLLLQTASNGLADQAIYTQFFAYRRASDLFVQVYGHVTGRNENEEVRYVTSGPLAGSVVSAEPTSRRPYVYWITVNRLTRGYTYRQVLRYRSVTGYADGNGLAVIDSEMPNIEERLGLWRQGLPMPLPSSPCPKPRLVHMELWCG